MSSSLGSVGVGGIKQGGTEHDNVVMQHQVGAEGDSKTTEREGASAKDETTDKKVRPDQPPYDSKENPNNDSIYFSERDR